jgi:hypothetical protein
MVPGPPPRRHLFGVVLTGLQTRLVTCSEGVVIERVATDESPDQLDSCLGRATESRKAIRASESQPNLGRVTESRKGNRVSDRYPEREKPTGIKVVELPVQLIGLGPYKRQRDSSFTRTLSEERQTKKNPTRDQEERGTIPFSRNTIFPTRSVARLRFSPHHNEGPIGIEERSVDNIRRAQRAGSLSGFT